jgi:hypothetical protein
MPSKCAEMSVFAASIAGSVAGKNREVAVNIGRQAPDDRFPTDF